MLGEYMHLNPLKRWQNHPICYNCASLGSSQGSNFWAGWWSRQEPVWINHGFLFSSFEAMLCETSIAHLCQPQAPDWQHAWRGVGLHGILLHALHKFIRFRTSMENLLGWRTEAVTGDTKMRYWVATVGPGSIGHCTLETISNIIIPNKLPGWQYSNPIDSDSARSFCHFNWETANRWFLPPKAVSFSFVAALANGSAFRRRPQKKSY